MDASLDQRFKCLTTERPRFALFVVVVENQNLLRVRLDGCVGHVERHGCLLQPDGMRQMNMKTRLASLPRRARCALLLKFLIWWCIGQLISTTPV